MARALIVDTAADQLRVAYDGTNYVDFDVSIAGDLTIRPTGGDVALAAALDVTRLSVGATEVLTATRVLQNVTASAAILTSGLLPDARIAATGVTQHQGALSIGWAQLTGTPTTLAGYGITGAQLLPGALTLAGPAVTVDGGVSNSEALTLRGFYDADATVAVASTKRDFTARNIVTSGAAYRFALLNDAGTEVFSVSEAGVLAGVSVGWGLLTGTPTTLAGYGITDAAAANHTHTMDDLSDVVVTTPAEGHVLTWDATNLRFRNVAPTAVPSALGDLTDVTVTTPAAAQVLRHNGTEWVNAALAFGDLASTPTTLAGYGITDAAAAGHTHSGADITTGTVAAARLGLMTGATALAAGTSGAVPAPLAGDETKFLRGDGAWIEGSAIGADEEVLVKIDGATIGTAQLNLITGTNITLSGANDTVGNKVDVTIGMAAHTHAMDDLSDVVVTTPAEGHVLTWDATNLRWRNAAQSGGGAAALNDLSDVTLTTPAAGQFLKFDGTAWVNAAGGTVDTAANYNWTGLHTFTQTIVAGEKITRGTADGADNTYLSLSGGGDFGNARGAGIALFGNEFTSNEGFLDLHAGNVAGARIALWAGNAVRMVLNEAGNLGIGASATNIAPWASNYRAIEGKASSVLFSNQWNEITLVNNAYIDSVGWKYKETAVAAVLQIYDGNLYYNQAASGTAGTAITWSERFKINTTGVHITAGALYFPDGSSMSSAGSANAAANYDWTGVHTWAASGDFKAGFRVSGTGSTWSTGAGIEFRNETNWTSIVSYDRTNAVYKKLVLDTGDIGVGTTDIEAWGSSVRALQLGTRGYLTFTTADSESVWQHFGRNAYFDGAWKYRATGPATDFNQHDGTFEFRVAASGTIDTAVTWTQALTINNSGNFGLQVTPKAWASNKVVLEAYSGAISLSKSSEQVFFLQNAYEDSVGYKYTRAQKASGYTQQLGDHYFWVAPTGTVDGAITWTQALTINNSGNWGHSVTPDAWHSTISAINIGVHGAIMAQRSGTTDTWGTDIVHNAYHDSAGWKYRNTLPATSFYQSAGVMMFRTAPSGTAGTAITWTDRFKVDANGVKIVNGSLTFPDGTSMSSVGTSDVAANYAWTGTHSWSIRTTHSEGVVVTGPFGSTIHSANKGGLDWATSKTRIWSWGPDTTTRGAYEFWSASSDASTWEIPFRISSGGNLGVNVGPHAWNTGYRALEFAGGSALWAHTTSPAAFFTTNLYYDSVGYKYSSTAAAAEYYQASGAHYFRTAPSGTVDTAVTLTTALVIDNNRNFGLGVTPGTHHAGLHVIRSAAGALALPKVNNDATLLTHNATHNGTNWVTLTAGGDGASVIHQNVGIIEFWVADTDAATTVAGDTITWINALRINKVGNLGVGVTPKAWYSAYKAVSIHDTSTVAGTTNSLRIVQNAYADTTPAWKYVSAAAASYYEMSGGGHYFYTAPTGTVDGALTWTTALAINNAGNLGIGTSDIEVWTGGSTTWSATHFRSTGSIAGTDNGYFFTINNAYFNAGWLYRTTAGASKHEQVGGAHYFRVAPSGTADTAITWTTALTIASNGGTLVGLSSPRDAGARFNVDTGSFTHAAFIYGSVYINDTGNTANNFIFKNDGAGQYRTSWTQISDARRKKNVVTAKGALDRALRLRPVWYESTDADAVGHGPRLGLISQEVQKVLPSAVNEMEGGFLGVEYAREISTLALASVREEHFWTVGEFARVDDEVTQLRNRVADLEQQVAALSN